MLCYSILCYFFVVLPLLHNIASYYKFYSDCNDNEDYSLFFRYIKLKDKSNLFVFFIGSKNVIISLC